MRQALMKGRRSAMVNHEFEIMISFTALIVGLAMLWMARSQPD